MDEKLKSLFQEICGFLAFEQPKLKVETLESNVFISGEYDLKPRCDEFVPTGRLDRFMVELLIPRNYPYGEPILFETGNRIPQENDRHVNQDGSCCFGVWEAWIASNQPASFEAFINGPIHNYFFGQYFFEQYGKWPHGEYKHGESGLLESYAEVLECVAKIETVRYHLQLFSQPWPKGHWCCPCGSHRKLRECCRDKYESPPISPQSAKLMKKRFDLYFKSNVGRNS